MRICTNHRHAAAVVKVGTCDWTYSDGNSGTPTAFNYQDCGFQVSDIVKGTERTVAIAEDGTRNCYSVYPDIQDLV